MCNTTIDRYIDTTLCINVYVCIIMHMYSFIFLSYFQKTLRKIEYNLLQENRLHICLYVYMYAMYLCMYVYTIYITTIKCK